MRNIDRRRLLIGVGALLAAPLACYAQQADKVRRIGFLSLDTADSEAGQTALKLFPDALKHFGYVERGTSSSIGAGRMGSSPIYPSSQRSWSATRSKSSWPGRMPPFRRL